MMSVQRHQKTSNPSGKNGKRDYDDNNSNSDDGHDSKSTGNKTSVRIKGRRRLLLWRSMNSPLCSSSSTLSTTMKEENFFDCRNADVTSSPRFTFSFSLNNDDQDETKNHEEEDCSSSSSSQSTNRSSNKQDHRVSFSHVEIREHARCLGDHPSCPDLLVLSLDW
eukprot:CAMPEP_0202445230 /NCGR_PEP_ID=MMETSP1360-20130828/4090_1 /ASSEMBLY_ACC=CAM_ASM_000848 /TAXON_ID=515479 /ORGANISM="Licmophora paradoxa, Strain CCMP2313" /LENGTH=164 /DNA_ID=CAMNT_0049061415 /DNA_START=82 /DNA_END=573 /DNA_ORIENTATION=+